MLVRAGSRFGSRGFGFFDRSGEVAACPTTRTRDRLLEGFRKDVFTGVHRLFGARHIDALPAKPRGVNIGLGGDDHRVCGGNVLGRQLVLGPYRTLSLHFNGVT